MQVLKAHDTPAIRMASTSSSLIAAPSPLLSWGVLGGLTVVRGVIASCVRWCAAAAPRPDMSRRDHIAHEILESERYYVRNLGVIVDVRPRPPASTITHATPHGRWTAPRRHVCRGS